MDDWTGAPAGAGSVIAIAATNAPLLTGQCKALARRVTLGLSRTGTTGSHQPGRVHARGTGIFEPELSRLDALRFIPWGYLDDLYAGVVHASEEAVLNALS